MKNNKVYNIFKYFLCNFNVICLILFNIFLISSCGLDKFYYIEAPKTNSNIPLIDSSFEKKVFSFNTMENISSSGFEFVGTEVYYKIYSDKKDWESEKSSLCNLAQSDNGSAADKLINPKNSNGYGYQTLRLDGKGDEILIPYTGSSQNVEIRISDYQNDQYASRITINGKNIGKPVRCYGIGKSFNFGRDNGKNIPNPIDANERDVKEVTSLDNDHIWYVALFAVSKGHDAAYSNYYSNITYLGSVSIRDDKEDN